MELVQGVHVRKPSKAEVFLAQHDRAGVDHLAGVHSVVDLGDARCVPALLIPGQAKGKGKGIADRRDPPQQGQSRLLKDLTASGLDPFLVPSDAAHDRLPDGARVGRFGPAL